MLPYENLIRHWFAFDGSCCNYNPPNDAIVIHIQDFSSDELPAEWQGVDINASVILQILEKYNYINRQLWIVCSPESKNSKTVTTLQSWYSSTTKSSSSRIIVVTGKDEYDALCTLTRSKTLILSHTSEFSQIAGFLAGPSTVVHSPITTRNVPDVTISVPFFKYHLISSEGQVEEFDVAHERITFGAF